MIENQKLKEPKFPKINSELFFKMRLGHNCFLDKICVSARGEVHPCVMERDITYGNVKAQSLFDIFSSSIAQQLRRLSKDYINVCRDCEYRYCCFDCRVKARDFLKDDFHAKPWWCLYDPFEGQWREKKLL